MGTKTVKIGTAKRNGTPKAAESSDILTLEEAAAFLRVQASALQADALAGRVPSRFVAGEWRFSKSAFLTWLQTPAESTSKKPRPGSKEAVLSVAGLWKDDPTVDDMIRDIYEQRRKNPVEGD